MLAAAQLCNVRSQQACSLLPCKKHRSTERVALLIKPSRNGLRIPCSRSDSASLVRVQRVSLSKTFVQQDILVLEATDWEHPASQTTPSRFEVHLSVPRYIEAQLSHASNGDHSVFPRTASQPWTCAKAPKYVAAELAEWEVREDKESPAAQVWLIDSLRLRNLSLSTIKSYYTAYGIQQICQVLCLNHYGTKEDNVHTLVKALNERKPILHKSSYNTLQLAN